jgi:hypothetical protein
MEIFGTTIQWLYLIAGLASVGAVSAIIYRLGYPKLMVAAPAMSTAALIIASQALAFWLAGIAPFAFGVRAALMPALMIVPPASVVLIAFSSRFDQPRR